MISVRNVLVSLGIAFTVYLTARGVWWTSTPAHPVLVLGALAFYLATALLCILWVPSTPAKTTRSGRTLAAGRLPVPAQILALISAIAVPAAVGYAAGPELATAPFATWYLGGIGALMTVVMIRHRPWTAWAGIMMLSVISMVLMGPANALALGLVGSVVWVTVAQLLVRSMDRAARDTDRLAQLQRAASAWQASHVVRQRERRVQVQRALSAAGPILGRTIATGGEISAEERVEARIAEGRLRDEMRGPRLIDHDVQQQLERARRRGATVTVLDEGGLDEIDEIALKAIRAQLAETLRQSTSDRLYIRTSHDETVAVTVVGRSASSEGLSDEDSVELWHEIHRAEVTR
ncbi:hypothetical protein ACWPKO_24285 (plasmid) [Coraliomargarita sp. W4R53]